MNRRALKERLGVRFRVPSLPAVLRRLERMLADPDVGIAELGAVAALDPAFTAALLRVANSSHYELIERVTSPTHAAAMLGTSAFERLLAEAEPLGELAPFDRPSGVDPTDLWRESILLGHVARQLAARVRTEVSEDELATLGHLCDVGRLVMLGAMGEEYLAVVARARTARERADQLETDAFGFAHTDVGAIVASRWSLGQRAVLVTGLHHEPAEKILKYREVVLISVANQVTETVVAGSREKIGHVVPEPLRRQLNVEVAVLEDLTREARRFAADLEI